MKTVYKTGREFYTHFHSNAGFSRHLIILPVLGYALLLIFPALLLGCNAPEILQEATFTGTGHEEPVKVAVRSESKGHIESMDIFVFNNDILQRLDCYQRFGEMSEGIISVASRKGAKKVAVCANSGRERNEWKGINSLEALHRTVADLENEQRGRLLMSAEADIMPGNGTGHATPIYLKKLAAEIVLQSISCDFSGKPYEGEKLENVKIYLTNVNASCKIMSSGTTSPERIINAGGLNLLDMEKFADRELVMHILDHDVGPRAHKEDISLICYPNCGTEEGPGTPFTRLVIEGQVGKETWYWPIDINRSSDDNGGNGVERNCQYIYDINIRRKGSSDPDIPAKAEDLDIKFEIREWDRKQEYDVQF